MGGAPSPLETPDDRYMMARSLPTLCLTIALATASSAQIGYTVGPKELPLGCNLSITVSNDVQGALGTAVSYQILDRFGNLVFDSGPPSGAVTIGPWGWLTKYWDQKDQGGAQVPPGLYVASIRYDVGATPVQRSFEIVPQGAGLVLEGTATIHETITGESRRFYLCAPQDPGASYLLLASFTNNVPFAPCGKTIPLDPDALFTLTLTPNTVFKKSLGTLNANGVSFAPVFDLPEDPALVGVSLEAAFVVLSATEPCFFRIASDAHSMTIL